MINTVEHDKHGVDESLTERQTLPHLNAWISGIQDGSGATEEVVLPRELLLGRRAKRLI